MSERTRIRMAADEVAGLLNEGKKVQVATVNMDGTPHLVTMFYTLVDGKIAFFTYRASQKARNLSRDPRIACLVEAGEEYGELRGAVVYGTARRIDDYPAVAEIGTRIVARTTGRPGEAVAGYVGHTARKRVAYVVEPDRIVSWDHRKLAAAAGAGGRPPARAVSGTAADRGGGGLAGRGGDPAGQARKEAR